MATLEITINDAKIQELLRGDRATSSKSEDLFEVFLIPSGFFTPSLYAFVGRGLSERVHRDSAEKPNVSRGVPLPNSTVILSEAHV